MKKYEPATPRAALGVVAVAVSACTLWALIILPANLDADSAGFPVAAAKAATTVPVETRLSAARQCEDGS